MKRLVFCLLSFVILGCKGKFPVESTPALEESNTLSVMRNAWSMASTPDGNAAPRGHLIWYNPYEMVPIREVWPDREVTNPNRPIPRIHVLRLGFKPRPGKDSSLHSPGDSWGGVQRVLYGDRPVFSDSLCFELTVQGDQGRLHFDFGLISEDVIPNGKLDSEDRIRGGLRDAFLDENEDTGLDGVFGPDPPDPFYPHIEASIDRSDPERTRAVPFDFWDIDGDDVKGEQEPWSNDDWRYEAGVVDYRQINGTEGSRNDGALSYPNTEDLNMNDVLDMENDYFEFSFSLDKTSPDTALIQGGLDNTIGWRLYRLPLSAPSSRIGSPDWSRVECVRIWIDGAESDSIRVSIAKMTVIDISQPD